MLMDKLGQTIKLTDVYYAPTFTKHIVSMRKLIDDNWAFRVADKMKFVFMDPHTKGTVKFGRKDKDMLYCYFTGTQNVDFANDPLALSLTIAPVSLDINIAHGLLRHLDIKTVTASYGGRTWVDTHWDSETMWFMRAGQGSSEGNTQEYYDQARSNSQEKDSFWTFWAHTIRIPLTKTSTLSRLWMTTCGTVGTTLICCEPCYL